MSARIAGTDAFDPAPEWMSYARVQVDTALSDAPAAGEAGDHLERLCKYCCSHESQLVHGASFFQSGQMLVEAIQGALPRPHAVQVLPACIPWPELWLLASAHRCRASDLL